LEEITWFFRKGFSYYYFGFHQVSPETVIFELICVKLCHCMLFVPLVEDVFLSFQVSGSCFGVLRISSGECASAPPILIQAFAPNSRWSSRQRPVYEAATVFY
jgi:hypothetical protein